MSKKIIISSEFYPRCKICGRFLDKGKRVKSCCKKCYDGSHQNPNYQPKTIFWRSDEEHSQYLEKAFKIGFLQ